MKNVYTVAQVNGYIKNMFTQDFLLQSIPVSYTHLTLPTTSRV